jgi:hypothetical protein
MNQIAKVELISVYYLDVYKWLRKEMDIPIVEAKNLSQSGNVIDFNGDIEKAISFYNYLNSCMTNSARLIIDHSYSTIGCVGAFVDLEENMLESIKYSIEFDSEK